MRSYISHSSKVSEGISFIDDGIKGLSIGGSQKGWYTGDECSLNGK